MEEEEIDFKVEAEGVIDDIGFTVNSINISKKMPSSRQCVYLNVMTKENKSLCVELSVQGFRVVGEKFDEHQESNESRYFETMYALLDSMSPGYTQSFAEALVQKLSSLQGDGGEDDTAEDGREPSDDSSS